jgi:hypothetical protein
MATLVWETTLGHGTEIGFATASINNFAQPELRFYQVLQA